MRNWKSVQLKDAGTWLSGGTPFTDNPRYWDGDIPWISAASLKDFRISRSDRCITELGAVSGTRLVPPGTVLFVVRGMSLKTEFRVGVTERQVAFGQDCKAIIPVPGVDAKFLALMLKARSRDILAMVDEAGHGTGRLPTDLIAKLRIDVPGLPEQRRITEILDSADDQIRATESVTTKLRAALCGVTDQLMRNGISGMGGTLRPGRLSDFIHLQRGFDITAAEQREGEVPVVSSSGITSNHDLAMVKGPGVVIGRKGKLGNAYYVDSDFWPHDTTLWITDFKGNDPKFVARFLKWMRLERFDAATSVPTLNRNSVHPLQVAIPDPDEQRRIVAELEGWESRIQSEGDQLAKLRTLKQGLMDDLVAGRVRVTLLHLGVEFAVGGDAVG